MVFEKEPEDLWERCFGCTDLAPEFFGRSDRGVDQLTKGLPKPAASPPEAFPRPLQAAGFNDPGRRIRTAAPRGALIEVGHQTLGLNRPIRQVFRWQDRDRTAVGGVQISINPGRRIPRGTLASIVRAVEVHAHASERRARILRIKLFKGNLDPPSNAALGPSSQTPFFPLPRSDFHTPSRNLLKLPPQFPPRWRGKKTPRRRPKPWWISNRRNQAVFRPALTDEEADALGETIGTLFGEQLHDGGQEIRVFWVGHG